MTLIQIALLIMALAVLFYFWRLRSRSRDRFIVTLISLIAIMMILLPNWTTQLAHLLGVGRGTDLLIYLGFVAGGFLCILFYSKDRDIEERMTQLARAVAILHAKLPTSKTNSPQEYLAEHDASLLPSPTTCSLAQDNTRPLDR